MSAKKTQPEKEVKSEGNTIGAELKDKVQSNENPKESRSGVFTIRVKNISDNAIEDVSLFDYEHEKQRNVVYSTNSTVMNYNSLLRKLTSQSSNSLLLRRIRVASNKAISPKKFHFKECDIFSVENVVPQEGVVDPYQQQSQIIEVTIPYNFYLNSDSQITIDRIEKDEVLTFYFICQLDKN